MIRRSWNTYVSSYRGLPREVWLLSGILLINRSGTMVLPFFVLYVTSEHGHSASIAGNLLAVYGVGAILGNYLGGVATMRYGAIRVQVIGLLGTAVAFLGLMVARSVIQIGIGMVVLSLVAEGIRPALSTATASFARPEVRSRAYALTRLAVNLGMSIGSVVGGLLATVGFTYLFITDAATAALSGVVVLFAFGWRDEVAESESAVEESPDHAGSPWRDKQFLCFLGLLFLTGLVFFQLLCTFGLYLEQIEGMSRPQIGLMFAVNTLFIVFFEMLVVQRTERYPLLHVIGWGSLLSGIGFGMLPFGSGIIFCAVSVLVWTVGEMVSAAPSLNYASLRSSAAQRGQYLAMVNICLAAASVAAPIVGTRIFEFNPNAVWYACLAAGVVTFVGFYMLAGWSPAEARPETPKSLV